MPPKALPEVLGIWAGSSPASRKSVADGFRRLKALGIPFWVPDKTRQFMSKKESQARPYLAGPDRKKAEALFELWANPRVKNILCVRGGYGSIRVLPRLDQLKFKPARKVIWGFSDATPVQNYLYQRFQTPWVHSPMLSSDAFQKPAGTETKVWKRILGNSAVPPLQVSLKILNRGRAFKSKFPRNVPMIGGNLTSLISMVGTPWQPRPKKAFWLFLEDVNEEPRRIDRSLQQLLASGLLKKCRGVLLGHFTDCPGAQKIVKLWAQENGITLLSGVKAGHERPNVPLAMGVPIKLTLKNSDTALLTVPIPFLR